MEKMSWIGDILSLKPDPKKRTEPKTSNNPLDLGLRDLLGSQVGSKQTEPDDLGGLIQKIIKAKK